MVCGFDSSAQKAKSPLFAEGALSRSSQLKRSRPELRVSARIVDGGVLHCALATCEVRRLVGVAEVSDFAGRTTLCREALVVRLDAHRGHDVAEVLVDRLVAVLRLGARALAHAVSHRRRTVDALREAATEVVGRGARRICVGVEVDDLARLEVTGTTARLNQR